MLLALGAWESTTRLFQVPPKILPAPTAIVAELVDAKKYLGQQTTITLVEVLSGFGIGLFAAIAVGIPLALSPTANAVLTPHVVLSQVVPKAALAPLLVIWVGYGLAPKILVAGVSSLLPLLTGVAQGLAAPTRDQLELFEGFAASRQEVFLRLRSPLAIPYLTAALQMGFLYALLGAITAEFVNSDKGLGHVLLAAGDNLNTPLLFAAIACAAIIGLVLSGVARVIDRTLRRRLRLDLENG